MHFADAFAAHPVRGGTGIFDRATGGQSGDYQVRCNAGSRWFVLQESYTDFGRRTGEVRIWHDFDPCPDPETVENWIRLCLATAVKT